MPKRTLRQLLLARRREMAAPERDAAGLLVQEKFIRSEVFRRAGIIALYAPIQNEVATGEVFRAALALGKQVLFPAVSGSELLFRQVSGPDGLRRGAFGIMEPLPELSGRTPGEADLIVVPAVAFSRDGQRIGYGKGYYDRALHPLEGQGRLVGFCYDFQLVDDFTGEPHDVRVDRIITEKRELFPGRVFQAT